ncbi:MAG: class I SAM-dependent methyltransferase [Planctomycetaceae bacterium]|jgi:ubiquinone/menaquinone biosynthesis C-methylase UbiE|nr:class I SAM-dependent methyltransferase [Planctomycetaceae bacterium]
MIPRRLEPEVMDTQHEAREYDEMDHSGVNELFVSDFLSACPQSILNDSSDILDLGTGTALIPIEFCRQSKQGNITAIDLADEMLKLAKANIERADLSARVRLIKCDAKQLPFENDCFSVVISNSIIHHIPEPLVAMRDMVRVLKLGGLLFVRDLMRPDSVDQLEALVDQHTSNETDYSRQLFRQSLHAALTVSEVVEMLEGLHLPREAVVATSDRHWTVSTLLP